MTYAGHSAAAIEAAEKDDDASRLAECERRLLGSTVERLKEIGLPKGSADARFIEQMDTRLNVLRELPQKAEIDRIKALAWTHRRKLPRRAAAKLPPHDPIVREGNLG